MNDYRVHFCSFLSRRVAQIGFAMLDIISANIATSPVLLKNVVLFIILPEAVIDSIC